ncbi:MAG: TIGR02996 domain-containing protein [Gemmataceae bacterium]
MSRRRIPPQPLPLEPFFRRLPGSHGFLQAIAEEPDEDLHRLVLADWLDEQGHSLRAEFIRLSLQLARMAEDDPRTPALQARWSEFFTLGEDHLQWWDLRTELVPGVELLYDRGMLERAEVTAARFPRVAAALFSQIDCRQLVLLELDHHLAWLARPELGYLQSLALTSESLSLVAARRLAQCRALANLHTLRLWISEIDDRALEDLRRSPYLHECEIRLWDSEADSEVLLEALE